MVTCSWGRQALRLLEDVAVLLQEVRQEGVVGVVGPRD
jgi:hypothetical protein